MKLMSLITNEIKDFLSVQKLGYVATVSSDGTPNISPKGTIIGWDDKTLSFANIRSPDTMNNLQHNPNVEINVLDPLLRKGYLFKGKARILKSDPLFEEILSYYKNMGIKSSIDSIVLVDVSDVTSVISPLYDLGVSEDEIKSKWKKHFAEL